MSRVNLYELLGRDVDLGLLPHGCPARAAERMRKNYLDTGDWDIVDQAIVLGDPRKGVDMFSDTEQTKRQLLERVYGVD